MSATVPHNIFVPFTDKVITDTALIVQTEHGYWVSALRDVITHQDIRALNASKITKKALAATYNACVYVVVFNNGRIKIGQSANPIQRCATYIADGARFGVGVQRCWISPRFRARNVSDFEQFLLGYARIQGTCAYGNEYFTHPNANYIIAFAIHHLPIESHSIEIQREDALKKCMPSIFVSVSAQEATLITQLREKLNRWVAPTTKYSLHAQIFDTLTDVILDDEPGNFERMRMNMCRDADVITIAVLDLISFEGRPALTDMFPTSTDWYVTLHDVDGEQEPRVVMRSRKLWEAFRSRTRRSRTYEINLPHASLAKIFATLR